MLRIVVTVLKFLLKQIKELTSQKEIDQTFEDLKARKRIVFEAW